MKESQFEFLVQCTDEDPQFLNPEKHKNVSDSRALTQIYYIKIYQGIMFRNLYFEQAC